MFEVIREGDILLHHPYDSFASTVERFIQAAADDPDVLAIKLTLYRTGGDSSIAKLLQQAAEQGKQVAVLIELQARFDEENNIIWAQRLEDVGVHVSYGVAGLKTHARWCWWCAARATASAATSTSAPATTTPRRRGSTPTSASSPATRDLGADLTDLFNLLTGFGQPAGYRQILVAPRYMLERFLALIHREIEHQLAGRAGRIIAKMNSLVDPGHHRGAL